LSEGNYSINNSYWPWSNMVPDWKSNACTLCIFTAFLQVIL